ncbi:hypothetical protein [Lentzea tibetensis]|nr:hypothetical protein [Lentzea tibetensis]
MGSHRIRQRMHDYFRIPHFTIWVFLTAVFAAAGAVHIALAITYSVMWAFWVAALVLVIGGACALAAVRSRL